MMLECTVLLTMEKRGPQWIPLFTFTTCGLWESRAKHFIPVETSCFKLLMKAGRGARSIAQSKLLLIYTIALLPAERPCSLERTVKVFSD